VEMGGGTDKQGAAEHRWRQQQNRHVSCSQDRRQPRDGRGLGEMGRGQQQLSETGKGWQRDGRGAAPDQTTGRDETWMTEDWASLAAVGFNLFSLHQYFMRGYLGNVQAVWEGLSIQSSFTMRFPSYH
jgi:hypothetical protein